MLNFLSFTRINLVPAHPHILQKHDFTFYFRYVFIWLIFIEAFNFISNVTIFLWCRKPISLMIKTHALCIIIIHFFFQTSVTFVQTDQNCNLLIKNFNKYTYIYCDTPLLLPFFFLSKNSNTPPSFSISQFSLQSNLLPLSHLCAAISLFQLFCTQTLEGPANRTLRSSSLSFHPLR